MGRGEGKGADLENGGGMKPEKIPDSDAEESSMLVSPVGDTRSAPDSVCTLHNRSRHLHSVVASMAGFLRPHSHDLYHPRSL